MKISKDVLTMLKWMTEVNGGIKIDAGNKLYTKSEAGSMCAVIDVEDVFPVAFNTSNLKRFLSIVELFNGAPNFEFDENKVTITSEDGKMTQTFYQSNPAVINQSNKAPKPQTDIAIKFTLESEYIKTLFRASSALNVSDIELEAKNGEITLSTLSRATSTTDKCSIKVGTCDPSVDCVFYYKKQNLKLIPEWNYEVEVYNVGLSKFTGVIEPATSTINNFVVYVVTNK